MSFIGSVIVVLLIAIVTQYIGRAAIRRVFGSRFVRTPEAWALSALTGSGLVMSVFGWLSFAGVIGRVDAPLAVGVLLALAAVSNWRMNQQGRAWSASAGEARTLLWLLAIAIAAVALVLIPVGWYRSFNPYNDTVTYITISDYLQTHSFINPAQPNPHYPILGQVVVYQVSGYRMGALFFLACIQAFSPVQLAIEIFPAVAAWAVVLNVFALYLGCRWIALFSRPVALAAATLGAMMVNPLHYAAQAGFFPQLFGTAYMLLALALIARFVRRRTPGPPLLLLTAAALGFLISAYSELFPLVALATALMAARRSLGGMRRLIGLVKHGIVLAACTALFANVELLRMLKALPGQMRGVVGWHVDFTPAQFLGAALGLFPGSNIHNYWEALRGGFLFFDALLVVSTGVLLYGAYRLASRDKVRGFALLPPLAVFAALFLYFRFAVKNPWFPERTGQSWSMFKLSQWAYPFMLMAVLAGAQALLRRPRALRVASLIIALLSVPAQFSTQYRQMMPVRQLTRSDRPFQAYADFARIARQQAAGRIIELNGEFERKHRQLLVYFLRLYPVVSDWRDDFYISPWLTPENRNIRLEEDHLVLVPADSYSAARLRLPAGVTIGDPERGVEVEYHSDWYPVENQGDASWRWSAGVSSLTVTAQQDRPHLLSGAYSCADGPRTVSVILNGMQAGAFTCSGRTMQRIPELPLYLRKGENEIQFKSDRPPVHLPPDTRALAFMIKNLDLEPH